MNSSIYQIQVAIHFKHNLKKVLLYQRLRVYKRQQLYYSKFNKLAAEDERNKNLNSNLKCNILISSLWSHLWVVLHVYNLGLFTFEQDIIALRNEKPHPPKQLMAVNAMGGNQ